MIRTPRSTDLGGIDNLGVGRAAISFDSVGLIYSVRNVHRERGNLEHCMLHPRRPFSLQLHKFR